MLTREQIMEIRRSIRENNYASGLADLCNQAFQAISLAAENASLKDSIRDWAHDYGFDHDDKAMQDLEAIIGATGDDAMITIPKKTHEFMVRHVKRVDGLIDKLDRIREYISVRSDGLARDLWIKFFTADKEAH
jgi:hypothetical protein